MAIEEDIPLLSEQGHPQSQLPNHKRDLHILCWAFLLVFLAFGAVQNLESTINNDGDLGTISLGILYVSFAVFSLFSSLVVRKLKPKKALVLGTTGYWLFVAANLKPSWYTLVPASVYLGFAASIIWVGEGTYLTAAAGSHAADHKLNEGAVVGHFNGQFWGIFATHQFSGNLITLIVLRDDEGGRTSGTTLLLVLFLIIMTSGIVLMLFLSSRNSTEEIHASPKLSLSSSVVFLLKAEYTKEIVKPTLGERGVGGAMAVYGIFDAIFALAAGRLTSGLRSVTVIVSAGAFIQLVVLLWLLLGYSASSGLPGTFLPLLIGALWGIGDAVLMTQLSAFHGILFKHDLEGAFSQLKLWQSVSIAVVFFISTSLSLQMMVVIMIVALCISMVGFLFLTLHVEKAFSNKSAVPA